MTDLSGKTIPEYLMRINAALALRDIPDHRAALDQLQSAIELAPTDASAHLLLGLTYQDLDQLEAAEESLRRAVTLAPESSEARQALGLLLVQTSQYNEAAELLRLLAEDDIHNATVQQAYATALAQTGRRTEAIKILEATYKDSPEDADVAVQLGHLLLEARQLEDAVEILQRATELSDSPDVLCDLAATYAMLGRFDTALDTLNQALQLRADYDRIWRGLAYCHLRLKHVEEALEAADKALEYNDQSVRNWQYQANALSMLGRKQDALNSLERAIELARQRPDRQTVLELLLVIRNFELLQSKGPATTLAQIEQDLEELPDFLELLHLKTTILLLESEYEQALATIQEVVEKGANEEAAAWDYFHAYHGLGKPSDAWAALELVFDRKGKSDETIEKMEQLGVLLYRTGRYQSASAVFEQVLKLEPGQARTLNNLGFILIGENEWERAEDLLNQALRKGYEWPAISLTNLGYMYLLQHKYDEALQMLQTAGRQVDLDEWAILRVACWYNGEFSTTPGERFPRRFIPISLAVQANLVTAYYLSGQTDQALAIAQEVIDTHTEDNIGYRVLGCLHLANGDVNTARSTWEKALKLRKSKAEARLIQHWLDELPASAD